MKEKTKPTIVCSAFIEKDKKFLLVFDPLFKVWRVPGGRAEFNEALEETLIREMGEEIGLKVENPKFLGFGQDHQLKHLKEGTIETSRLIMFFYVKINEEPFVDPSEAEEYKWVTFNKLKNHPNKEGALSDFFQKKPKGKVILKEFKNNFLVDCFIKFHDKYLLLRRKKSERWFPGYLGSIWRDIANKKNPYQALKLLLKKYNIKTKKISLKAVANNIFVNTKEVFNVFLFIVKVEVKPKIDKLPEADEIIWVKENKLVKQDKILDEYKIVFPLFKDNKVLFYHTKYDFDKMLKLEIYNK